MAEHQAAWCLARDEELFITAIPVAYNIYGSARCKLPLVSTLSDTNEHELPWAIHTFDCAHSLLFKKAKYEVAIRRVLCFM